MYKKVAFGLGTAGAMLTPFLSFAALPTDFSTTTASTILGVGYDTFIDVISGIAPILLPVFATVGFILGVWYWAKSKTRV